MTKPFFVYMRICADGAYYVGHTDDLDRPRRGTRRGRPLHVHDPAPSGPTRLVHGNDDPRRRQRARVSAQELEPREKVRTHPARTSRRCAPPRRSASARASGRAGPWIPLATRELRDEERLLAAARTPFSVLEAPRYARCARYSGNTGIEQWRITRVTAGSDFPLHRASCDRRRGLSYCTAPFSPSCLPDPRFFRSPTCPE
jgi:hypothetical protein